MNNFLFLIIIPMIHQVIDWLLAVWSYGVDLWWWNFCITREFLQLHRMQAATSFYGQSICFALATMIFFICHCSLWLLMRVTAFWQIRFWSSIIRQYMDLRLLELLGKYQEEELEAIERWFNHTQPLALDIMGNMKIARGTIVREKNTQWCLRNSLKVTRRCLLWEQMLDQPWSCWNQKPASCQELQRKIARNSQFTQAGRSRFSNMQWGMQPFNCGWSARSNPEFFGRLVPESGAHGPWVPISTLKRHLRSSGSFEIMHSFKLPVHGFQLSLDVICVRHGI